ncbi:MAG: class I SAM-dependent methyltransferase, partial [Rhodobacterales bacterium]
MDKKTIAYYNSSAQVYLDKISREKPDSDLQSFIAATPLGGDVLDLGCGPGNSAAMMRAAGLTVYASDGSLEMVH